MKSTGLRLTIVIALLYSVLSSVALTLIADESTVLGAVQLQVVGTDQAAKEASVTLPRTISNSVSASNSVVIREERDSADPAVRHLYLSGVGKERSERSWLAEGYPAFSNIKRTVVHSEAEFAALDLRGTYFILSGEEDLQKITSIFEDAGLTVESLQMPSIARNVLVFFVSGPLTPPTIVVLLLLVLLISFSALAKSKAYSIKKLHGLKAREAIQDDANRVSLFAAGSLFLVSTATTLALWLFNGLKQIQFFAGVTASVCMAFLLMIFAVHALTVSILWKTNTLAGIKGHLGLKVAAPVAYAIRIPGLLVVMALAAAVAASAQGVAASKTNAELLKDAGNISKITFGNNIPAAQYGQVTGKVGQWLKKEEQGGNVITVISLPDTATAASGALLVNNEYLKRTPVLDKNLNSVTPAERNSVKILLPEESTFTRQNALDLLSPLTGFSEDVALSDATIATNQEHLLYNPDPSDGTFPSSLANIPLIVYGPGANPFSDEDFMSFASGGQVLVADGQQAARTVPENLKRSTVHAFIPVLRTAQDQYAAQLLSLRTSSITAFVALCVLLSTAFSLAQVHLRGNAQTIRVRYLHGWSFFATHQWLFKIEIKLALGAFVFSTLSILVRYLDGGSSARHGPSASGSALELGSLLLVLTFNAALLVLAVASRSHSKLHTNSEETA